MKTILMSLIAVSIFSSIALSARELQSNEIEGIKAAVSKKLLDEDLWSDSLVIKSECDDEMPSGYLFTCHASLEGEDFSFSVTDQRPHGALLLGEIIDFDDFVQRLADKLFVVTGD